MPSMREREIEFAFLVLEREMEVDERVSL